MQDWLAHRARATPGQEALVNAGSGNAWSYATLDETVEEMAGRLHALGVGDDDHLAAVLGTGVESVCLVHAAMRIGTTLVPLSPEFTPPELSERFERADVDAVVCAAGTEATVRKAAESVDPWLDVFTIDDADWSDATPLADAEPASFTPATWAREDVQLLLFTSGTTGRAKAVQLTMGNLLASATASGFRLGIDPEDRWLVPLSLHHMGGIAPVLRSALYGTTAIIRESFDPGATVDDIKRYEATCISLVPTMLRRMLSARGTLPDTLRFLLVGGAPCPEELIHRCRDFSVPVCPTYGMTETASQIATARHREAYESPGSVGRPLLWTDVTVVDETGNPVGHGETGELVVSGPTVTPGYYDDPAATGEAMGPHGLHTGDVGYQDEEGRLYVLNRLDDRILTGGENVDPGEVVDAIREHPDIADAAVVGLPDEEWGEQVAALLVPEDEPPDTDELEPFLRDRLAGFKLPRTLGFADELPRTVSGTVEREAVRERLTEGETERIERNGTSGRAATETETGRSVISEGIEGRSDESGEEEPWAAAESPDETSEESVAESSGEFADETATGSAETGPPGESPEKALEGEPGAEQLELGAEETGASPAEAEESGTSARSILDAGSTGDAERESLKSIDELVERQAGDEGEETEADEPAGRAALDEALAGDETGELRRIDEDVDADASGGDENRFGLEDRVETTPSDQEEAEEGEEAEKREEAKEREEAEKREEAKERKGSAALAAENTEADESDLDGVQRGRGAALGTGRESAEGGADTREPAEDDAETRETSENDAAADGTTENETSPDEADDS